MDDAKRQPAQHISDDVMEQFLLAGLPESDAVAITEHLARCSECHCRIEVLKFWGGFR